MYLDDQDSHISQNWPHLSNVFRFVDDALITGLPALVSEHVLPARNNTKPQIAWESTSQGDIDIPYLDVKLSLVQQRDPETDLITNTARHDLHRKPLNAYLYVPATSAHPLHVKMGSIRGETERILR